MNNPEYNFYPVDIAVDTGTPSPENPQPNTPAMVTENSNILNSANGSVVGTGTVQSPNFAPGASGWRLDSNGNLEANDGNFRGDITGASGTFSGLITAIAGLIANWTISSDALSTGAFDTLNKMYFGASGLSLSDTFKVTPAGVLTATDATITGIITALSGLIGGWTIDANSMYAITTGTIKTGATVGAGSNGVIIDKDGIKVYDATLGVVVSLPSDGSAPSFSSGNITETTFEISTNAVLRTSATVGDGSASSEGILINSTGIYGCKINQLLADGSLRIYNTGSFFFGSPTNYLQFDGTYLKLLGSFEVGANGLINNSSYTVANLPIAPTEVGFEVASAYE